MRKHFMVQLIRVSSIQFKKNEASISWRRGFSGAKYKRNDRGTTPVAQNGAKQEGYWMGGWTPIA